MLKVIIDAIISLLDRIGVLEKIKRVISNWDATWTARIVAYLFAPGLVLGIAIVFGGGLSTDRGRDIAISELKTEFTGGDTSSKRGVVVIAEPVFSEYQIPLAQTPSKIWSSLDEEVAKNNADHGHLALDANGFYGRTPFIGENGPVVFVIEGDMGRDIWVSGNTKPVEHWRLPSRRPSSLVPGALLVCSMAFGIGVATGTPIVDRNKNNATEVRTEPDKD